MKEGQIGAIVGCCFRYDLVAENCSQSGMLVCMDGGSSRRF